MTVQEDFLHFVWQNVFFEARNLKLTSGEDVQISRVGDHNLDSGPDFLDARLIIAGLEWSGHVEIHTKSSLWDQHNHHLDAAYNGVILHVVLVDDQPVFREDGTSIPTLALEGRINEDILTRYEDFKLSIDEIPCRPYWAAVPEIIKVSTVEKALFQRLEKKTSRVFELYAKCKGDWDDVAFKLLAENFGFKINKVPFQLVAASVPAGLFRKLRLLETEAVLFGQAGFLSDRPVDAYQEKLKKEYDFIKNKHRLSSRVIHESIWKFGRLRPANFPTRRMAQFAAVISQAQHLFESLVYGTKKEIEARFSVEVSSYWSTHFRFGESVDSVPGFGRSSAETLIINTTVPLLVAFGKQTDDQKPIEQAIDLLTHIKPESNRITRKWETLGFQCSSSAESQGVLELFQSSCIKKKCLWCNIGMSILNRR